MFQISNLSCWGPSGLSKSKKFSLTNFPMFMDFFCNEQKSACLVGIFTLFYKFDMSHYNAHSFFKSKWILDFEISVARY